MTDRRRGPGRPDRPAPTHQPPVLPDGGGLLLVDKPGGPTSHDVVGRTRAVLRTRRVGHAGTLDPMATGLLVLAVDRSTRLLGRLALATKTYTATIRLGAATTTDDAEGEAVGGSDATRVGIADVDAGLVRLTGDLLQVPSSVSAIKVDGRRSYDRVRAGEAVELAARPVTVSRFDRVGDPRPGDGGSAGVGGYLDVDVVVDCSTGTYIRALARDLGADLGVGGHLTALRRTAVGPFDVADAVDVFAVDPIDQVFADAIATAVIPAAAAARVAFGERIADDDERTDLRYGRPLAAVGRAGVYAVFDGPAPDGQLLALVEETGGKARPVLVWQAAG